LTAEAKFYFHFMFLQLRNVVLLYINSLPDQKPDFTFVFNVSYHSLPRVVVPAMLDSISVNTHFTRFL